MRTFNMIKIKGGRFKMGCETGFENEKPISIKNINDFLLSDILITQKIYFNITGIYTDRSFGKGDNFPVYYVSWIEAIKFCNNLSEKYKLQPCYNIENDYTYCDFSKNGFRLPTEVEWEFAAKGGINSKGYYYSGANNLNDVAWYQDNSNGKTHPVAQKLPNELGLYDMNCNLWEWCWDNFDKKLKNKQKTNYEKVIKGGGWCINGNDKRFNVSSRSFYFSQENGCFLGFRIAKSK